ncbi:MAG: hypothetical protein KDA89_06010, partial [Planctomycetaceae bacterium]|nr:hypothetical protein [Planctomycetaceae bacterium]
SGAFDGLLKELCDRFDLVLVDVGPVLAVTDPCVISRKVDEMLLVVRPANDTKPQVRETVRRLKATANEIAGCVINGYGSGKEFLKTPGNYGYYGDSYTKAYREALKKANGRSTDVAAAVIADGSGTSELSDAASDSD